MRETDSEQIKNEAVVALIAQATSPMLLCTLDSVLAVSEGFCRLTGFSAPLPLPVVDMEQLMGVNPQSLSRYLAKPNNQQRDVTLRAMGTKPLVCSLEYTELDSSDGSIMLLLTLTDRTEQRQTERLLGHIVTEVSDAHGVDFFNRLTRVLCETLHFDGAAVAVFAQGITDQLDVISRWLDSAWCTCDSYDIEGTPCQRVIEEGEQLYRYGVQGLFPDDLSLSFLGVEGYLGLPLRGDHGEVIGVVSLLSRQPIKTSDSLFSLLRFICERAEAECSRKQTQERLAVSELGLSVAERLARFGTWTVDIERQVVMLSEHMQDLYQLPCLDGELPRSSVISRLHPDDREAVLAEMHQGERGQEAYSFTHRILLPDNSIRWIHTGCEPVWEDGRLVRILGVSQDITELINTQQQAYESEHLYRKLIESCPYGITQIDKELRFVFANAVAEKILGYRFEQLKDMTLLDVVPEEERALTQQRYRDLLERPPQLVGHRRRSILPSGEERLLDVSLNYVLDNIGNTAGFIGFMTDITEKTAREVQLRQLSTAVEQSPSAIMISNKKGELEYVNPAFESTTGYLAQEILGHNPRFLNSGKVDASVFEAMWRAISAGQAWRGELLNKRRDGSLYWELASIAPIRSDDGEITHYVSINEDISRIKDQEAQLAYQANYDPVTNLPNRILAMDRLTTSIKNAHRDNLHSVVMFLDLDQFKRINDTFGHSKGDEVLIKAADKLAATVRASDTVARFGGDEFVILMDSLPDLSAVETVSEKVLRAFSRPVSVGEHELTVTASIGIAVYPQDGEDAETLLRNADAAMYSAKAQGRNNFHFFTPELNQHVEQRLEMESLLLRALELDELSVHYQPVVDLSTGHVVGAEALMRWHNHQLGQVSPECFIPLAEDLGFIDELGHWIVEQVMQQYDHWRELIPEGFRCAINVSPKQFQQGDFADQVLATMHKYRVPGPAIELEVTEGLLMNSWPEIDQQIEQLSNAGISLSIDDFGTGYSSISYLRKFPFNTLKIDRSFVHDLVDDNDDSALVLSVIALAKGMGLAIIAEGVETLQQYEFLRDARCSMMQGYLFSRPLPQQEFEQLLYEHRQMSDLTSET